MKFKAATIVFLLFFLSLSLPTCLQSQSADLDPVSTVTSKLKCSEAQAVEFLKYVSTQIGIIQIALSEIASSERNQAEKQEIIDFLLEYIVEEGATVLVSSRIISGSVNAFTIEEYLYHLSRLSQKYNYKSVKLSYDLNYLHLLGLENLPEGNRYEMHILVKQYFSGSFSKYGMAYKDLTLKNLICTIREIAAGKFELKLKSIQVRETLDVTEEELAQARKDFEQHKRKYYK